MQVIFRRFSARICDRVSPYFATLLITRSPGRGSISNSTSSLAGAQQSCFNKRRNTDPDGFT